MKLLIDTNIILDHLLDREPFNHLAAWIFSQIEYGNMEAFVGGTTVTTIYYLIAKTHGAKAAHVAIEQLLRLFEVAPITRTILASALRLKLPDFEDAVLHEAAAHVGADAIITRDTKCFRKSNIVVYSSEEFIASMLKVHEDEAVYSY